MLINQNSFASPEIGRLICDVLREDAKFENELRSMHRERLVCPVTMKFMNGSERVPAFSRNISPKGIALVCGRKFAQKDLATLEIYRLGGRPYSEIVAECRWSKPFGEDFWVSGWQFLRVAQSRSIR